MGFINDVTRLKNENQLAIFLGVVAIVGIVLVAIFVKYENEISNYWMKIVAKTEGFSGDDSQFITDEMLAEKQRQVRDELAKSASADCPDRIIQTSDGKWAVIGPSGTPIKTFRRPRDVTEWMSKFIEKNRICRVPFYQSTVSPGEASYINNPIHNLDDYQVSYIFDGEGELDQLYRLQQPGSVHPDPRLLPSPEMINSTRQRAGIEEEGLVTEWKMSGSQYDPLPFPVPISAKDMMTPSEQLIDTTQKLALRIIPPPNPDFEHSVKEVTDIVNNNLDANSAYKYRVERTGVNQFEVNEIVPRVSTTAQFEDEDNSRQLIGYFGNEMPMWSRQ